MKALVGAFNQEKAFFIFMNMKTDGLFAVLLLNLTIIIISGGMRRIQTVTLGTTS